VEAKANLCLQLNHFAARSSTASNTAGIVVLGIDGYPDTCSAVARSPNWPERGLPNRSEYWLSLHARFLNTVYTPSTLGIENNAIKQWRTDARHIH
jgi:hypothetical protein